jgi:hypothetical protein
MKKFRYFVVLTIFLLYISQTFAVFAQNKSQEYSEEDGIPVLTKHLPDFENVGKSATYILNSDDLRNALGTRPVFEAVDFTGGTEAVTAQYPQGKLLIVEYTTPQFSIEADSKIQQKLSETPQNPPVYYRRIGNYSAFVFDATEEASANALLDQIQYEKDVRWLGKDPFALKRAERFFVLQASDLFTNIFLGIAGALGFTVVAGVLIGIVFFYFREQKRSKLAVFSDAGGMTRLNLDGFTPEIMPDRLLDE